MIRFTLGKAVKSWLTTFVVVYVEADESPEQLIELIQAKPADTGAGTDSLLMNQGKSGSRS
jgi:hypothetical protein